MNQSSEKEKAADQKYHFSKTVIGTLYVVALSVLTLAIFTHREASYRK